MTNQSTDGAVVKKNEEEPAASCLADADVESFNGEMEAMETDLSMNNLDVVAERQDCGCLDVISGTELVL